jgi:hypothetical protein
MKKIVLTLLAALGIFAIYWFQFRSSDTPSAPKQEAIVVKKHSSAFNNSVDSLLQSYFEIKAAFVNTDSSNAKEACNSFILLVSRLNIEELKKDSAGIYESAVTFLGDIKSNAESLFAQKNITEMRQDFKAVSENIYPLLKTIHYEGKKLYWQNCPMAFGEDNGANWISNTEEILNPYLGKNHPEFKGTMLHCGEIKDTIQ